MRRFNGKVGNGESTEGIGKVIMEGGGGRGHLINSLYVCV